ncbi:DUF3558 family protein [Actinokineospora pegani]|uniref:DUF3558 family protein n=1 Tax=Actinokineospora pegani TaxID=2654637 RepID=UPI0012EA895B|nr:DUF3558 family protein [Actinokineospora pegani]
MKIRVLIPTAALIAVATACTNDETQTALGPAGAGFSTPAQDDAASVDRRAGRAEGSLRLGDLNGPKSASEVGAPFDPCTVVTWDDFPEPVRPTDGKPHPPVQSEASGSIKVRCSWSNSGQIEIQPGARPTEKGGRFQANILWSDKLDADPAREPGSVAKQWAGKPGLLHPRPEDPKFGKQCLGLVTLANGTGGVIVANARFPSVDPCAVADGLMNAIASR